MRYHKTAPSDDTEAKWRSKTERCASMVIVLILTAFLVSCSSLAMSKSEGAKAQPAVKAEERPPRPGDTKIVDGVEFEYVRNVLFSTVPAQPEYQWEKKIPYGK